MSNNLTEPPFSGKYYKHKEKGDYHCGNCGQLLFTSDTKFDSRSGWPAFDNAADKKNIKFSEDLSHGMIRTEISCNNCGQHLGHYFDYHPTSKTGDWYCVNSCALDFKKKEI